MLVPLAIGALAAVALIGAGAVMSVARISVAFDARPAGAEPAATTAPPTEPTARSSDPL